MPPKHDETAPPARDAASNNTTDHHHAIGSSIQRKADSTELDALAEYHVQVLAEAEAEAFWNGFDAGQAVLLGATARAMSAGASDRPSVASRALIRQLDARAAQRVRQAATPVSLTWSDSNPLPVRCPGESVGAYRSRYEAAARAATVGAAA
jgi:hypothetical protein